MKKLIRKSIRLPALACVLVVAMSVNCSGQSQTKPGAASPARGDVVSRFIQAIQSQDFKTVVDLTAKWQADVAAIKAGNPQALWNKLVGEYYQQKVAALSQTNPGYWAEYAQALLGSFGDPTQSIRALRAFLPRSSKWTISETRPGPNETTVYVTVKYPEVSDSPIIETRLLQETMLQFLLSDPQRLVLAAERVPRADMYWVANADETRVAMAKRFHDAGFWKEAITSLDPLESQNRLNPDSRNLLASAYYARVRTECFRPFVRFPDRFVAFGGQGCVEDINHALTLNASRRQDWVDMLVANVDSNIANRKSGGEDFALSMAKLASQFTAGDPTLESAVAKARDAVGQAYLEIVNARIKNAGSSGFQNSQDDLQKAMEMSDRSRGNILEWVKGILQKNAMFAVLDWMKKVDLRIPASDVPEFVRFGQQLQVVGFVLSPADERKKLLTQWENLVKELAAP